MNVLFNGEVLITECGSEALMTFKERTCEWWRCECQHVAD